MKKIIVAAIMLVFASSLFAQCPSKYGTDSIKCREQITLFDMTYKAKKNEKRKMGHRQPYTKIEIGTIKA